MGVVTRTSTVPAVPGGSTALIEPAVITLKLVAGVEPKSTAVAPVKFVPPMITDSPPAKGPALGSTTLTEVVGADTEVEAIWTAGLVHVRWIRCGLPSVTVRASLLVAPADTEAVPAALPAVKLTDEALVARWTGNVALGGRWMTGTVRVVVWVDWVVPVEVTVVV